MDRYYVLVTGNGVTTRANLEALMEDHYYANGPKGILVLAFNGKPSQGQVFAAQMAKDKGLEILVWNTKEDAEGLPPCTVVQSDNPLMSAVAYIEDDKAIAFVLWSDEDQISHDTLAICKEVGVKCFDLTDGLNPLIPSDEIKYEKPVPVPKPEVEVEEEDENPEDDLDEDDEDMDEEDEVFEAVFFGLEALAKMIAKAVVAELDASKKPQKGSKA
jgi:hypothetical protein